jgi:cell fate (sporulation/competence/biofilm development) regulator YlbF (YheA/YmcA/DUF963 family)
MAIDLQTRETPIIEKTKALCRTIVEQPQFGSLLEAVDSFMNDPAARTLYEQVSDLQQLLVRKQESGQELTDEEIGDFEAQRDQLTANPVAAAFLDARQQIYEVQDTISSYVSKTFEIGRVPLPEDLRSSSGGCCGGHGGGGCGCH